MNRILTAIGFLTIVGQSSLTVGVCNIKQTKTKLETEIDWIVVSAINQITKNQLDIEINSELSTLKSLIISKAIKEQLSKAMKNLFNKTLFKVNKVTDDRDCEVLDIDLKQEKSLSVHVSYDYGEFKNQMFDLIINIHQKNK